MEKERTFKIILSDEQCSYLIEKAHSVGLTASELLANFIGDLSGEGNGAAEEQLIDSWFNRCWFGMYPHKDFVSYLIEECVIYDVLDDIKNHRDDAYIHGLYSDYREWASDDPTPTYKDAIAEVRRYGKEFDKLMGKRI